LDVSWAFFEDLLFAIDEQSADVIDTKNDRSLQAYDVVYLRFWGDTQGPAWATARFCALKGIPCIDGEALHPGSFNKITQYMNLHEAGVPFPKTLAGPAVALIARYKTYGFDFPLILKSAGGTRGQDNYIVRSEDDMRRILQDNPTLTFVLQTFLPNEGDYRVLVLGDKVAMVIRRTAHGGSHLNNTSQGGTAERVAPSSLPPEVLGMSVRAAQFYGRQIAGVDMVRCTADGRWYCFEVNRGPQIEHASFEREKAAMVAAYLRAIAKK
jgi:glutathione synthase/RimK-type ligase-like ATP-grasp enzyme